MGVGPVKTLRLNREIDVVSSGRLAFGCVCTLWNQPAFTSALGEACFYHKVQMSLSCFPHPYNLAQVGTWSEQLAWSGIPLCHFMTSVAPSIFSQLIAYVGMMSRAYGGDPWDLVSWIFSCQLEMWSWVQTVDSGSSKAHFFFFPSEDHLPICEVIFFFVLFCLLVLLLLFYLPFSFLFPSPFLSVWPCPSYRFIVAPRGIVLSNDHCILLFCQLFEKCSSSGLLTPCQWKCGLSCDLDHYSGHLPDLSSSRCLPSNQE